MAFTEVTPSILSEFEAIVGQENVLTDPEKRYGYSHDETEDYSFLPDVVLKPCTTEEISKIMKFCNKHRVPVTPRGAGTGLSGGALPIQKGVVVSMERFNKILHIDEMNLQSTVEPGVITEVFQNAVKEKNLFYPPDPASRGSCFIGGNVAENSGGPKAVKYGVTRDYVLNLEVVLPTGEVIWTGANVLKNSTGYNLTQLMCGSEGTLGIITKIVFKLRGFPQKNVLLLIPFITNEEACKAIAAIFTAGIQPSGMEFFEREAALKTIDYVEKIYASKVTTQFPETMDAYLLCELDGNDEEVLMRDAERVMNVIENFQAGEILFAETNAQKEELWKIRKNISPAVSAYSLTKSEDVVVPRANLPKLITGIKEIGKRYGFNSVCFGHLGDGNLHVNVLKEQISDEDWSTKIVEGIGEIFKLTVSLGGTLSGEHGIGIAKQPYMPIAMKAMNLEIMRGIKKVFDPHGILNPGRFFDLSYVKRYWQSLSNLGVTANQPSVLVRRIRLQNQVSLLFILSLIFISTINLFNSKWVLAALELAFATVLFIPIYFNNKKRYTLSAILFLLLLYALVLCLCFLLPKRELEYLLLVLAVVPLTSYKSFRITYGFFSLSFTLFIATKISVYGLQETVVYLNYALIFLLTFFTVKYLKNEFEENVGIIETQNNQLKKLNDEKSQLISIASHDLRSPLNRIQSLLSLLRMEGSLSQAQNEILRSAQREAKQQTEMISEILDVYAIDEGRKTILLGPVNTFNLISELVSSFQPLADKKSIIIQLENKATTTDVIADNAMLKQVLENLLSNAIKFSYPNSSINILLRSAPRTMIISVKDQGQGLDAEDHKKLFKRFQRLSATPTAGEATSGLGLSIAKKYAEAMKGSLTCISEKGKGAIFTVELPLHKVK